MSNIHHHPLPASVWAGKDSNTLKRNKFYRDNSYPGPTEIKFNLSTKLGQIFLDDLPENTKDLLGLNSPLKGPGDVLWADPSQEGTIRPTMVPVQASLQEAMSHLGIIGNESEGDQVELPKAKLGDVDLNAMLNLTDKIMQEEIHPKLTEQMMMLSDYVDTASKQDPPDVILLMEICSLLSEINKSAELRHDTPEFVIEKIREMLDWILVMLWSRGIPPEKLKELKNLTPDNLKEIGKELFEKQLATVEQALVDDTYLKNLNTRALEIKSLVMKKKAPSWRTKSVPKKERHDSEEVGEKLVKATEEAVTQKIDQTIEEFRLQVETAAQEQADSVRDAIFSEMKELFELQLAEARKDLYQEFLKKTIAFQNYLAIHEEQRRRELIHELEVKKDEELKSAISEKERILRQQFEFEKIWYKNVVHEAFRGKLTQFQLYYQNLMSKAAEAEKVREERLHFSIETHYTAMFLTAVCELQMQHAKQTEKLKEELLESDAPELEEQIEKLNHQLSSYKELTIGLSNLVAEVVREFQKFISFAFKEVPMQSQFMLSVPKMVEDVYRKSLGDIKPYKAKAVSSTSSAAAAALVRDHEKIDLREARAVDTKELVSKEVAEVLVDLIRGVIPSPPTSCPDLRQSVGQWERDMEWYVERKIEEMIKESEQKALEALQPPAPPVPSFVEDYDTRPLGEWGEGEWGDEGMEYMDRPAPEPAVSEVSSKDLPSTESISSEQRSEISDVVDFEFKGIVDKIHMKIGKKPATEPEHSFTVRQTPTRKQLDFALPQRKIIEPRPKFQVVGEGAEYKSDEFLSARAQSMMNLFKKHPELQKVFLRTSN